MIMLITYHTITDHPIKLNTKDKAGDNKNILVFALVGYVLDNIIYFRTVLDCYRSNSSAN